jgi:flagellar protein FliL
MAKTPAPPEQTAPATPEAAPAAKLPIKKLIMFGVPLFVVQLVLVYFLITKVLAPAPASTAEAEHGKTEESSEKEKGKKGHGSEGKEGKEGEGGGGEGGGEGKIYIVKDLIVNPAGTNGTRFLLTTVGFEVTTPEALKDIEAKDVMVRDALNTIFTSKDLTSLVNVEGREALRKEIQEKVGGFIRDGELTNVYFSKFIIQ